MIRVLNFLCVAAMGLTILGLYHVSEQTRVTRVALSRVERNIADERTRTSVLQTEWVRLASPEHIQQLAESSLNMGDTATAQLSSLDLLPRRGEAPLGDGRMRDANAQAPQPSEQPEIVKIAARSGL